MAGFTLVCGGGGVWGVAWMTGVVTGLADAGVDLRLAAKFIGTSAGAVVSTLLPGDLSVSVLFERQAVPARQTPELEPPAGGLAAIMAINRQSWADPAERLRAVCKLAREAPTVDVAARRASIAARLAPQRDGWPETPLLLTAVDADTGELAVFGADSGVSLTDAVAASCAVPGVWPPVPIGYRRYIDGGVWRTAENAHLAEGSRCVIILSPLAAAGMGSESQAFTLAGDVARLEAQGTAVMVIAADADSLATMASGPLDPASRTPAAWAGRRQGLRHADAVMQFLAAG